MTYKDISEISTGLKGNDIKILRVLNSFRRVF